MKKIPSIETTLSNVLTINGGSSSIKFALYRTNEPLTRILYGNIDRIVESPFFVDSAANSGVQAVDAAAFAVRRYLENKEYENFSIIFDKFDRDRKALHGIRHFRRFDCDCTICKERKGKRNADTNT